MKFYISGPKDRGEGSYGLLTETGEAVAGHFCSSLGFARSDLTVGFPKRREELEARFGPFSDHEVVWLGDVSEAEQKALLEANEAWWQSTQVKAHVVDGSE